jgi:hypothetical protein
MGYGLAGRPVTIKGEADAMILADAFRQEGDARPCLLCRAKVPEWDQIDWVSRAGIVCRDCLDFVVFSH